MSIFFVLCSHSTITTGFPAQWRRVFFWIPDGNLGVRFFFVISGFLITWIMLVEREKNGRINLFHFYIRRILRIFPVYFAFLGVLFILQGFTPLRLPFATWIANLTFTSDFLVGPWTSAHLWSVAVEEQFYLVWPVLFLFCYTSGNINRSVQVLVVPILLAPLCRLISYWNVAPSIIHPLFQGYAFFNYVDSLAFGCLLALYVSHRGFVQVPWLRGHQVLVALVGMILILAPHFFEKLQLAVVVDAALGNTIQAAGFCLILLQSLDRPTIYLYSALNWSWVKWIGVLSYSIYMWQMLFCTNPEAYGIGPVWWLSFPGWLLAVLVAATVSYYGLEKPFFGLRSYFRKRNDARTAPEQANRVYDIKPA